MLKEHLFLHDQENGPIKDSVLFSHKFVRTLCICNKRVLFLEIYEDFCEA